MSNDKKEGRCSSVPDKDSLVALQALMQFSSSPDSSDERYSKSSVRPNETTTPKTAALKPVVVPGKVKTAPAAAQYPANNGTPVMHPAYAAVAHYGNSFMFPTHTPFAYPNTPVPGTNCVSRGFYAHSPMPNGHRVFIGNTNASMSPTPSVSSLNGAHEATAKAPLLPSASPENDKKIDLSVSSRPNGNGKRSTTSPTSVLSGESGDDTIRKEEIQAALHSKPQRGRKRENLSAEERLELTRTRNREHAKSTRIRKKARYQELLAAEEKYEEMQRLRHLTAQRQQCFIKFLAIRSNMLRAAYDPASGSSSSAGDDEASVATQAVRNSQGKQREEDGIKREQRSVSFQAPSAKPLSKDASTEARLFGPSSNGRDCSEAPLQLTDVVDSVAGFGFEEMGNMHFPPESARSSKGISAMKKFDSDLVSCIEKQYGKANAVASSLSYRAKDCDIVINDEGIGYAEYAVTVQDNVSNIHDAIVMSGMFKLRFASGNSKLSSVAWCNLPDKPQDAYHGDSPSSSSAEESLGDQNSYPSVVSLEHSNAAGENSGEKGRPRNNSVDGIGMNI